MSGHEQTAHPPMNEAAVDQATARASTKMKTCEKYWQQWLNERSPMLPMPFSHSHDRENVSIGSLVREWYSRANAISVSGRRSPLYVPTILLFPRQEIGQCFREAFEIW